MLDSIRGVEWWDKKALTDPIRGILSGVSEDDFWNKKPGHPWLNKLTKDMVFVDIGCGIGRMAKWVGPLVKQYHGIDISQEMLNVARAKFVDVTNVAFHKGEKDLAMLDDNTVDIVFTCLTFQHIGLEKSLAYIKDTKRVLKVGGRFLCYNIPNIQAYVDGFTEDDSKKAFSIFRIDSQQFGLDYFTCECTKISEKI